MREIKKHISQIKILSELIIDNSHDNNAIAEAGKIKEIIIDIRKMIEQKEEISVQINDLLHKLM